MRRSALDRDLAAATEHMRGRVLEIGAGRTGRRGAFRPPVEGCVSWTYLDVSERVRPHVAADVGRLPFRSASFDTVVCLEVLEYVPAPESSVSEMARVLGPGGALILAAPFLHRMDAATDYWRFTEAGLRRLVAAAGLEPLRVSAQGHALGVVANILRFAVVQRSGWRWRGVRLAAWPLVLLLLRLDARSARRESRLATFATGYLIVARRS